MNIYVSIYLYGACIQGSWPGNFWQSSEKWQMTIKNVDSPTGETLFSRNTFYISRAIRFLSMIPAFEEDGWVSQVPPFRWASDNPKIIIACLHIVTSVLSVAGFATAILFAHVDGGKSKGFVAVWSFLSAAGVSAVAAITFRFFVIPQAIFYTLGCMVRLPTLCLSALQYFCRRLLMLKEQ